MGSGQAFRPRFIDLAVTRSPQKSLGKVGQRHRDQGRYSNPGRILPRRGPINNPTQTERYPLTGNFLTRVPLVCIFTR
jgi:hypothetical protein